MTLHELATALAPIAAEALDEQTDPDVKKASVVLAALMGAIDGGEPDREVLAVMAINSGLICDHRLGKHAKAKDA